MATNAAFRPTIWIAHVGHQNGGATHGRFRCSFHPGGSTSMGTDDRLAVLLAFQTCGSQALCVSI
jgi:hypothetical protein